MTPSARSSIRTVPRSSPSPGASARRRSGAPTPMPRTASSSRPPPRARRSSPPPETAVRRTATSAEALPQTQLAVDDPSSQPFVTGVGGTTLSALGPRPSESVWNGGNGTLAAGVQAGAGGGGISDLWRMPPAQLYASPALRLLGAGLTGSQCGHPGGYCREVPDVSADADPATGYVIYWNGSGSQPLQESGWQTIGGTSAAAPVWSALIALADASPGAPALGSDMRFRRCTGRPLRRTPPTSTTSQRQQRFHADQRRPVRGRTRLRRGQRPGHAERRRARRHAVCRRTPAHQPGPPAVGRACVSHAAASYRRRPWQRRSFQGHAVAAGPQPGTSHWPDHRPAPPPRHLSRHRDRRGCPERNRGRGLHLVDRVRAQDSRRFAHGLGPAPAGAGIHRGGRPGGAGVETVPGHGPRRSAAPLWPRGEGRCQRRGAGLTSARARSMARCESSCRGGCAGSA